MVQKLKHYLFKWNCFPSWREILQTFCTVLACCFSWTQHWPCWFSWLIKFNCETICSLEGTRSKNQALTSCVHATSGFIQIFLRVFSLSLCSGFKRFYFPRLLLNKYSFSLTMLIIAACYVKCSWWNQAQVFMKLLLSEDSSQESSQ